MSGMVVGKDVPVNDEDLQAAVTDAAAAGRLAAASQREAIEALLADAHAAGTLDRAEADTMGYRDFVDLLLGEELGLREGRRLRTALKLSGLPHHKTLDEFDFAFQPDLDPRKVRDLATLPFLPRHGAATASNVALLGPPGTGKTHIAVALAVAACQAGYSIYFTTLDDCVRQLRAAEAAGRFAKKLQTYLRPFRSPSSKRSRGRAVSQRRSQHTFASAVGVAAQGRRRAHTLRPPSCLAERISPERVQGSRRPASPGLALA